MAWEARLGLKLYSTNVPYLRQLWLNGLGSPFGIETALSIGQLPEKDTG